MEAGFGGKTHNFYGPVVPDFKALGQKSLEWDLNDWKWDGDLFTATRLNSIQSDCRGRQFFPVGPENPVNVGLRNCSTSASGGPNTKDGGGKSESDKRRREVGIENGELHDEDRSLNLELGGQLYPIMDEDVKSGKKTKTVGNSSNRAVCQVEGCRSDLSNAKDYHRRHKVCDIHSKASEALVGNVMQRFCQQCSRFHILQEFDEGKRSCRRRLAGHNRRRRKTHHDTVPNEGSFTIEQSSSYLLKILLRILSNVNSNGSDQVKEQDVVSHLLKNLATISERNLSGLLQGSQGSLDAGPSMGSLERVPNVNVSGQEPAMLSCSSSKAFGVQNPLRFTGNCAAGAAYAFKQNRISPENGEGGSSQAVLGFQPKAFQSGDGASAKANGSDATEGMVRLSNIDLNSAYDDSQDHAENLNGLHTPVHAETGPLNSPSWVHPDSQKSSPVQTSRNSDSTSTQSASSSSGEAQSRTGRIVFKLFGKDPNDLPLSVRAQLLDWLSQSPTDIESYIRPGCIVLTIYLRMGTKTWDELCSYWGSGLQRLLEASNDPFWKMGWVYARVQHRVAFIYNGEIVLDTHLPLQIHQNCRISSIKPIAVSPSENVQFIIKGFNLCRSSRFCCAFEGKYLVQESCAVLLEGADSLNNHNGLQCISLDCTVPNASGRGFIEVEDHDLSSSFIPFIVAEQELCSEIRMLEDEIELADTADDIQKRTEKIGSKNQALDFIHEMGWLLHRNNLKLRLGDMDHNSNLFSFNRFCWLIEFSMDHDWCAVVKKLLCILFQGMIDPGEHPSIEQALLDMGLLHRAVRRNCRPMVELLSRFSPEGILQRETSELKEKVGSGCTALFRPDTVGPAGLTPLHLAASMDGSESVLDALTDDPGLVGIQAWKSACDATGLTPSHYASLRGHYSYIHLVQKKIKTLENGQVVVEIPGALADCSEKQSVSEGHKLAKVAGFHTEKNEIATMKQNCRLCEHKMVYVSNRTSLAYRPAILSLVAIAAVCVCVALLFKSSPEVPRVLLQFRWETLDYGSM